VTSQPQEELQARVLAALAADGPLTQPQLVERLGAGNSPVYRACRTLQALGLVEGRRSGGGKTAYGRTSLAVEDVPPPPPPLPAEPSLPALIGPIIAEQEWRGESACRDLDPSLFFPDVNDWAGVAEACAVCVTCQVRAECLAFAKQTKTCDGIWGGELLERWKTKPYQVGDSLKRAEAKRRRSPQSNGNGKRSPEWSDAATAARMRATTPEERREISRRAGLASGAARRARAESRAR
jgi:WhiB family redox-sensing transcriptional regulator